MWTGLITRVGGHVSPPLSEAATASLQIVKKKDLERLDKLGIRSNEQPCKICEIYLYIFCKHQIKLPQGKREE